MKRLNTTIFKERAIKTHENDKIKPIYDKTIYINARTKVCITCPIHGDYWQLPFDHLSGKGCPKCCGKYKTTESFKQEVINKIGDTYDLSKAVYKTAKTKITVICKEHGDFEITPDNLLNGKGCPQCCRRNKPYTTESFIEEAKKIHGDTIIYDFVNFTNVKTLVTLICPIHGKFQQLPTNHLKGHGCPLCNSSKLENAVFDFLIKNKIDFEQQKRFNWLKYKSSLSIDFYIPSIKLGIECQGIQHYESINFFGGEKSLNETIKRDFVKYNLCKDNDVNILYVFNDDIDLTNFDVELYNTTNSVNISNLSRYLNEKLDIRYG